MIKPELQQSPLYRQYIRALGWQVEVVDSVAVFFKHFPLLDGLAKIQRSHTLPTIKKLIPILEKHKIRRVAIEPSSRLPQQALSLWCQQIPSQYRLPSDPYLPTKTILIDIRGSEQDIFQRFSEAKRRAVRRALKHGIIVRESRNIDDLIRIKNKSAGFLGFITTFGIKKLWPIFAPKHAAIILAYTPTQEPVGGVLLLFWNRIAYYWIAGATKKGKKLFAPTLLVWEAIKLSKKYGCTQFDFVGVWDERLPKQYDAWKGFTKFKEGFGGETLYYPTVFGV